ncbi:MAG TPA: adenylate/guanylate cyclase domain-containing protein [Thermomicrobiales bacterium]|nr:adenylate/guanylate cyclase domain-containing protein [Thermomicrobiales bacterium]
MRVTSSRRETSSYEVCEMRDAVEHKDADSGHIEEMWRLMLGSGESPLHRGRRLYRKLPASPRCKVCYSPFGGLGKILMRLPGGRRPGRMNPHFCNVCEDYARAHIGGVELELTMLFADIRGSTPLAERLGTREFARLIDRFYRAASDVLIASDALIDRLLGDEVVGLFVPAFSGERHSQTGLAAAEALLRATGHADAGGPWVPVGVAVHTGIAFVGSVGSEAARDITVLGDNANLTARLASQAGVGEILISQATATAAGIDTTGLESRHLELKGRSAAADVWVRLVSGDGTASSQ